MSAALTIPAPKAAVLVGLDRLAALSRGRKEVAVAIIDGPVLLNHPRLAGARIVPLGRGAACRGPAGIACAHGTFIAGVLAAGPDPAGGPDDAGLCRDCTILVRPIFADGHGDLHAPVATPAELAEAINDCLGAGAHVINLSLALERSASRFHAPLTDALDRCARRGVIVVAAAGNHGTLAATTLTRHPWVIPVAASDRWGRPAPSSNVGQSIGRGGLLAPGEGVAGISVEGSGLAGEGTSAAAPLITAGAALLLSLAPQAGAAAVHAALLGPPGARPRSVVPPLFDGPAALARLTGAARTQLPALVAAT